MNYWTVAQSAMDAGFPEHEVLDMVENRRIGKIYPDKRLCYHHDGLPGKMPRFRMYCEDWDDTTRLVIFCDHGDFQVIFHIEPKRESVL